jgi:hypothetical protein
MSWRVHIADTTETQHHHHAEQLAKDIALDFEYVLYTLRIIELTLSVIACVGGDGTFYEVLNGLANRPDAKKALRIPLAPIPTGKLTPANIKLTLRLSMRRLYQPIRTSRDFQRPIGMSERCQRFLHGLGSMFSPNAPLQHAPLVFRLSSSRSHGRS